MRRILVLLFLTLTALQLAFAGSAIAAAGVPLDSHWVASDVAAVLPTDHAVSHRGDAGNVRDAGEAPESPCDTLDTHQACTVCGACELCHPVAQPDGLVLAMAPRAAGLGFPPTASRYLSAEHAPSFKPPIL